MYIYKKKPHTLLEAQRYEHQALMSKYNSFLCVRLCLCGKQLISRTVLKHLRETEREGKREFCGRASVAGSVCETRCVSALLISFG